MRNAKPSGCTFQRTQSRRFFHQTHRRNDSGRAARALLIHFPLPISPLLLYIFQVVKTTYFEKRGLYETN